MPDLIEKIKTAIGEIYEENKKTALSRKELTDLVIKKLANGEIDDELILLVIEKMILETELMEQHDGKVVPYQFP